MAFSPDSTRLLVYEFEVDAQGLWRQWKALPVASGAPTAIFRLPVQALDPAWSPGGRGLTFRSRADAA
jgi:hypothetical protein